MNDLVERLRATNKRVRHSQELRDEAATEIERLQARIELLEKVAEAASACIAAWDDAKWPSPIPLRKALAALKEQP